MWGWHPSSRAIRLSSPSGQCLWWLAALGRVLPQTYTFQVMRLATLSGASIPAVTPALIGLALGAAVTMGLGIGMMSWALRRAERTAGLGVVV